MLRLWYLLTAFYLRPIAAFPSGAGGCETGGAVMANHLTRDVTTGGLGDGGFQVLLNNSPLVAGQVAQVTAGEANVITLEGMSGQEFLGFLIRADSGDGDTDVLDPTDSTLGQVAAVCTSTDVSGITHIINTPKSSVSAGMALESSVTDVVLDVTVVVSNNVNANSEYYYTGFALVQTQATPAPVATEPTIAPVTTPPTQAPVLNTVAPATSSPVPQPVQPSTVPPVPDCAMRAEDCTFNRDCCSNLCRNKPGELSGECISARTANKESQRLGAGRGGAGGGAMESMRSAPIFDDDEL